MSRGLPLAGRRVLITGAARGIGAALARRLHARGARVALLGLEPAALESVARACAAPWWYCDVRDRTEVETTVAQAAHELGGLDVVVVNAGVAAQLPLVEGDPEVMRRTLEVNVLGAYYTMRAAGPFVSHPNGYVLTVSSLAAAVHVPLLGAYSASKAAVEALGGTMRGELHPSGARVGVAYFAELDTEMTGRGFGTRAAAILTGGGALTGTTPLDVGIRALERGITRRSRRIVAPSWVGAVLPMRAVAQPLMEQVGKRRVRAALSMARAERAGLTTAQPEDR